jgi:L-lactate dehydrogenase complex protein LldF
MSHGFRDASRAKLDELGLGDKVHKATLHTVRRRDQLVGPMLDWESLRDRARDARMRALDRHEDLLASFSRALEARGVSISLAKTSEEACELIAQLVMEAGGKVTKSKSMTSEEVGLNQALEKAGAQVTETDLGELIVQLAGQSPSHVTAPAIHLSTEDVARIFRDKLGMQVPPWIDDPEPADPETRNRLARDLSLTARKHLRERFLQADVGISGANFLVAETGTVVLVENEGNILLTTALPKRHIVLAGIDKLIETEKDLGVLLRLLPVSATAQRQSCYVSLMADAHPDMHIVLLDHGRSKLMIDEELRDLLTCIRCGACMNVCPVYRNVGGHAYGGAYPGPIGSLLMPHLEGMDRFGDLPFASSLCGACTETCPVKIPLHKHLLTMRARIVEKGSSDSLAWPLRMAASAMRKGSRMDRGSRLYPLARKLASFHPTGKAWLESRELPSPPKESFRRWWRRERLDRSPAEAQPQPQLEPVARPVSGAGPEPTQYAHHDLLRSFQERMTELGPDGASEVQIFDQASVAQEFLRIRMEEHPADRVAVQGEPTDKREYALGITHAEMLIADTGGVVIDMRRRAEGHPVMLAETHIVVGRPSQIVPTVAHALVARAVKRKSGAWGDYQIIVTGPSRTADVEKVLVIPAHGPRRLVVVLCEEPVDLGGLRRDRG